MLDKFGIRLTIKAYDPIIKGYRPEIDISPELDDETTSLYQSVIRF